MIPTSHSVFTFGLGFTSGVLGFIYFQKYLHTFLNEIQQIRLQLDALINELKTFNENEKLSHVQCFCNDKDYIDLHLPSADIHTLSSDKKHYLDEISVSSINKSQTQSLTKDQLMSKIDELLTGCDDDKLIAYKILIAHKEMYVNDVDYLWRLSKCEIKLAKYYESIGNSKNKQSFVYDAHESSKKAIQLNDKIVECQIWYAMAVGLYGEYQSPGERLKFGLKYREHIDKAIELSPNNPIPYHLLGRWMYEVSQLTWVERRLANALFGEPPKATISEALSMFLKAEELEKSLWIENKLYISKCYIYLNKFQMTAKHLNEAVLSTKTKLQDCDFEARIAKDNVDKLWKQYKKYLK